MADQNEIVATFATLIDANTATVINSVLTYNRALSNGLFDLSSLDAEHRQQIRELSKTKLIMLRQRLEGLLGAVKSATAAPDI